MKLTSCSTLSLFAFYVACAPAEMVRVVPKIPDDLRQQVELPTLRDGPVTVRELSLYTAAMTGAAQEANGKIETIDEIITAAERKVGEINAGVSTD